MACSQGFANPVFWRFDCLVLCSFGVLQIQGHMISQLTMTHLGLVLTCLEASKSTGKSEPNVQVTAWPSAELGGMADGLKSPGKPSVLKT